MKTTDPNPENEMNEEEVPLDETGAEHIGSNNTDENSEGRKEGKSFYEKLRELHEEDPLISNSEKN
jgi:hypothetical protein